MNDKIAIWIVGLSLSSATKNIRFINNLILQMITFLTILFFYTQFFILSSILSSNIGSETDLEAGEILEQYVLVLFYSVLYLDLISVVDL